MCVCVFVFLCVCKVLPNPTVTDRLLNKMEKEQTHFDVQIGDGMDIGIMGENGRKYLNF